MRGARGQRLGMASARALESLQDSFASLAEVQRGFFHLGGSKTEF